MDPEEIPEKDPPEESPVRRQDLGDLFSELTPEKDDSARELAEMSTEKNTVENTGRIAYEFGCNFINFLNFLIIF